MLLLSLSPAALTLAMLAQAGWSVSGGVERFSYRDVSRSGPPADASPVEWEGSGPSLSVAHVSAGPQRHRFHIDLASAGGFDYVGPVRTVAAPSSDGATQIDGRYEYRRVPLRDVLARGLDAAIGVQGSGRRLSLTRGIAGGEWKMHALDAGLAFVVAAQFHRWSRWNAEVAWTNGLRAGQQREEHAADPVSDFHRWGGGWLTDLTLSGQCHLTGRAWLTGSWLTTGEGNVVTHHTFTSGRQRVLAGLTYAR